MFSKSEARAINLFLNLNKEFKRITDGLSKDELSALLGEAEFDGKYISNKKTHKL